MSSATFGRITIECLQGDIVEQPDVDAIVNAANAQLMPGGGVAGAIHRAAGPGLAEECRTLAPIAPGEAVITGAHRLPNRHVIHCLGPVHGRDTPSDVLLASCYRQALRIGDEHQLRSMAFPAISTGVFGYPIQAAARVAIDAIVAAAPTLEFITLVRFVLHSASDLAIHKRTLADLSHRTR